MNLYDYHQQQPSAWNQSKMFPVEQPVTVIESKISGNLNIRVKPYKTPNKPSVRRLGDFSRQVLRRIQAMPAKVCELREAFPNATLNKVKTSVDSLVKMGFISKSGEPRKAFYKTSGYVHTITQKGVDFL